MKRGRRRERKGATRQRSKGQRVKKKEIKSFRKSLFSDFLFSLSLPNWQAKIRWGWFAGEGAGREEISKCEGVWVGDGNVLWEALS